MYEYVTIALDLKQCKLQEQRFVARKSEVNVLN
jgi:hypothetical protein